MGTWGYAIICISELIIHTIADTPDVPTPPNLHDTYEISYLPTVYNPY